MDQTQLQLAQLGLTEDQLAQLGLTEEQITQIMQLGVLAKEEGFLNKELEMAGQLRQTRRPQGRFTGNAYVASSPWSHAASAINQVRGSYEQKQAIQAQRDTAKEQARLRQQFMQQYLRQQQQQQGATMTPGQIPPGGMAPPQRTPAQMFPMPAGGGQAPYGATMTPGMLRR